MRSKKDKTNDSADSLLDRFIGIVLTLAIVGMWVAVFFMN